MTGHAERRAFLLAGELCGAADDGWIDSIEPSTGEILGAVPDHGPGDVDVAVRAAEQAWPSWWERGPTGRAALLRSLAAGLVERADEIIRLEVRDTGNTWNRMRRDVDMAVEALDYFAGVAGELKGESIPVASDGFHFTVREPFGVVGRIIPFNHPIYFAVSRIAAPLAAGNSVVLKAPDQSPLSCGVLSEVAAAVLPAGVLNIIGGVGAVAGDALVRHPVVKRIGFTGSVGTGRLIQRAAADAGVKDVSLELGGKNPLLAFPDVSTAEIADAAVAGMNFGHSGQSCGSTSRLLLHRSVHDEVVDEVARRMSDIRLGDPLDTDVEMGPLNSVAHRDRVAQLVTRAVDEGAEVVVGGGIPAGDRFERGAWFEPTLLTQVTPGSTIARQEVFGPVLSVIPWSDEDELIEVANGTELGLTAAIWTNDLGQAARCARRVRAGYVWINDVARHHRGVPFGGMGSSGVGREEGLGELLSFTELKAIHLPAR